MTNPAVDFSNALVSAVSTSAPAVARVDGRGCRSVSALAYSADGLLVTAAHAVDGLDTVEVSFGDATHTAKVLGVERALDLAVLKLEKDDVALTPPAFADVATIGVGTLALAVGRPGKSVRASLAVVGVRGDDVRLPWGARIDTYLELDRTPPRGFAGGPVLDAEGKVLGVTTSLRHATIALPHAALKKVVDAIVAHGKVRRGFLGVGVQPVKVAQGEGALVVGVAPNSAAAQAGILVGDVLLTIDGAAVRTPSDLADLLRDRIDAKVTVHLVRGGQELDVAVTIGARP